MALRARKTASCATISGEREVVSLEQGRQLMLRGCLLSTAIVDANARTLERTVYDLGFLQLDSINSVDRAHHLILHARLDGYSPPMLARLAEKKRSLFEHWTHDASMIRSDWRHWWSHRFVAARERLHKSAWFQGQLGRNGNACIEEVRNAIRHRGPLMARDFPRPPRAAAGWWDWSPQKSALEYLWRTGEVAIHSRQRFDKVYDLAERVYGDAVLHPPREKLVHWACSEALMRLGAATPRELVQFIHAVNIKEAKDWCAASTASGNTLGVLLERGEGKRIDGVARIDWKKRAALQSPPLPARLLAPFDPLIRDRARALDLFNFDYRFEAFVPAAKRRYGYYTMPVLAGDQFVARVDLASERKEGVLRIARIWKEPSVGVRTAKRDAHAACERLAHQLGFRAELPKSVD
jgi:uncharacterized protein